MAKAFAKAFYNSGAWKAVRRFVLNRDHYTCRDCTRRAEEVHHVIELTPGNINDPSIALNPGNLVSLCGECHKKRTKGISDTQPGYAFDNEGQLVETR